MPCCRCLLHPKEVGGGRSPRPRPHQEAVSHVGFVLGWECHLYPGDRALQMEERQREVDGEVGTHFGRWEHIFRRTEGPYKVLAGLLSTHQGKFSIGQTKGPAWTSPNPP